MKSHEIPLNPIKIPLNPTKSHKNPMKSHKHRTFWAKNFAACFSQVLVELPAARGLLTEELLTGGLDEGGGGALGFHIMAPQ